MTKSEVKDSLGIVIVSGLSGAGKTVVLRALEDSGYFCIDNLPVILIEPFLATFRTGENIKKIGIGVDIREKEFLSNAYETFLALKSHYNVEILFLEAEKDVIVRRYKETRRPHPMIARHGDMNMETAIQQEKTLLSLIREAADKIMDTSNYTPHQLRHLILSNYENSLLPQSLNLSIISFGFKFGVPQNLDLLFDVRFLPNPYFIPELKLLKG
ncbi:MAG: RNase adapter RapZ, partial [Dissulfurispiraceae bacterium]